MQISRSSKTDMIQMIMMMVMMMMMMKKMMMMMMMMMMMLMMMMMMMLMMMMMIMVTMMMSMTVHRKHIDWWTEHTGKQQHTGHHFLHLQSPLQSFVL